jgi:hypothetical protein
MFHLVTAALALQLNGWFTYADVKHRLRGSEPKITHLYGNIDAYVGKFKPTSVPEYVVMAMVDDRIHGFLHDTENFRHTLWDGNLSIQEKINITSNVMEWLYPEKPISHRIYKYEDAVVFTTARQRLEITENSTIL